MADGRFKVDGVANLRNLREPVALFGPIAFFGVFRHGQAVVFDPQPDLHFLGMGYANKGAGGEDRFFGVR